MSFQEQEELTSNKVRIFLDKEQIYFDFVLEKYWHYFKTQPIQQGSLIVAMLGREVVGTVGVMLDAPLPFESIYKIREKYRPPSSGNCEFGRYTSTLSDPNVAKLLTYFSAVYAFQRGRNFAYVEQSKVLQRVLRRNRVRIKTINADLMIDCVREQDRNFYKTENPILNCYRTSQAIEVIQSYVDFLVSKNLLEFDKDIYIPERVPQLV